MSRRLLPDLTTALATWQTKVQRLCAEEAERTATARRLAEVLGTTPTRATHGASYEKRKLHLGWTGANRSRGPEQRSTTTPRASVEIDADRSGEYVKVELSGLSAAQAERVLRALIDQEQRGEAPGN
ncbi:hypothetical protein [Streptomyces sp. NPDC014623]|uniref:hypothetical protein n=1 Tax=Streptomyces sp. NPDC014623 TaxID=3364875 RepID=UPI0036FD7398